MKVSTLLQQTGMWRASRIDAPFDKTTPTGFSRLDRELSGNGWPGSGIVEFLFDQAGIGEMRLLTPALARLSREQSRWLLWVSPPYLPYPPALARAGIDLTRVLVARPRNRSDALWTLEKALSSQSCSAVLAWPRTLGDREIRRLQVASKDGGCMGVLMRPAGAVRDASPAELRLKLQGAVASPLRDASELEVEVIKRRGGWATEPFHIRFDDELNRVTPHYPEIPVAGRREQKLAVVSADAFGLDTVIVQHSSQ